MTALRIALLTYRGKPTCGGQGVYVRHLSRELIMLGHQVEVISGPPYPVVDPGVRLHRLPGLDLFAEPNPFRTPALAELRRLADWVEFVGMKRGGFAEPLAFSLRAIGFLRRHRQAFDLVHDNQGLGYGILRLPRLGLPVLATIHHPIVIDRDLEMAGATAARRAQLRRWYRFVHMQHRVARRLPTILTVSQASKESIVDRMNVRAAAVKVVPPGVDHRVFHPDRTVPVVDGRIVTTASADVPLKGLAVLLRALATVRRRRPAHLIVVGAAREDGAAARLIDQLGLAGDVTFRQNLSDAALANLLRSAQVACVPSLFEGFSLPAVEAMACGTPLVTTTAGALRDLTGPDHAIQVPPGDAAALATALGRTLDNPALRERLGSTGIRRAATFTWQATAEATVANYRQFLASSVSPTSGASATC